MSLTQTRANLLQRLTIERLSTEAGDDSWGQPDADSEWEVVAAEVPCRSWVDAGREPVDRDRTAVIVDRRAIVPLGTDVTESDRIGSITERGEEYLDGPMGIEAVLRRRDHLELALVRIR